MNQDLIEKKLYYIIDGALFAKYNGEEYHTALNSSRDRRRASILYEEVIESLKFDSIMSSEEALNQAKIIGAWSNEEEEKLEKLEKHVESLKISAYKNYFNPDHVNQVKKQITKINAGIKKAYYRKYKFYEVTKEYYANLVKRQFLIALSIRNSNNQPVYSQDSFWFSDGRLINIFMHLQDQNYISTEEYREIARAEPWRNIWSCGKHTDLFGAPPTEWSNDQRILCSFSKMYDNVYESPECPPDEVINDDVLLDGWFLVQKEERKKRSKENMMDKMFGQGKDGDHVFMVADTPQQAKQILEMNDPQAMNVIRAREQKLKQAKDQPVSHDQLPDVQMDLKMQATKEFQQKMKKG